LLDEALAFFGDQVLVVAVADSGHGRAMARPKALARPLDFDVLIVQRGPQVTNERFCAAQCAGELRTDDNARGGTRLGHRGRASAFDRFAGITGALFSLACIPPIDVLWLKF
jgi:hypothetical protein